MSISRSAPTNVRLNSISFSDNTVLTSASTFTTNLRGTKRLRIDGDTYLARNLTVGGNVTVEGNLDIQKTINFQGSIPYVDNQTGWGLPEWTFFTGTFNKQNDSLIIKITTLEEMISDTYATKTELTAATTLNNGLVFAPSGTYPLYNQSGFYNKGVTHLASNTYFVIRDSIEYPQVLQFQRGEVEVGHYLRCADDQGTVEWAALGNDIPVLTGINTSNGPSTSASFYVTDDVGGTRGTYFYPNMNSQGTNSFNSKLQTGDISLLAGQGNAQNGSTPYALFVGPFNGYQGLRMVSDTFVNGATVRGSSVLSGGQPEQFIELLSGRIRFKSGAKNPIYIEMTSGTLNSIPQGPFHIVGTLWPKDPSPVMIVTKQLSSMSKLSFMVNPTLNEGNWNDVVQDGDTLLYTANTSNYDPTESFPNVFTDNTTSTHLGVWSNYADALSVRQTIISEETSPVSVNNSGFIRLSACSSIDRIQNPQMTSKYYRIPRDYLMMDREGLTVKLQNSKVYQIFGKVQIKNKTTSRLNDPSTAQLLASLEVGSSSSNVPISFNGLLKYFYTGLTSIAGYILVADDNVGTVKWKSNSELFPSTVTQSVSFQNPVTFQDTIKYTKNLPSGMSSNKLFALGNDGSNGNVRWIEIPVAEDGEVEKPITFKDTIELYNQMFWINVDFGLVTAAAVGGIAYAIGKASLSDQKKGGQFWSSNDPGLTFYWRYLLDPANGVIPPYTYTCKMDQNALFGKLIRVADSYPPASDYDQLTMTDLQFFQSNKTITDTNPVTLNGVTYTVSTTKPGRFLLPGYFHYRNVQSVDILGNVIYEQPNPGNILIDWTGGLTFSPPGSESSRESYGTAVWKQLHQAIPDTWVKSQYFTENVFIGNETSYSTNFYGAPYTLAKNQNNLFLFGRLFFRYAVGNNDEGSSPLHYYLRCANASTGEVEWAAIEDPVLDDVVCDTLSVSETFKLIPLAATNKVLTCTASNGNAEWRSSCVLDELTVNGQCTLQNLNVVSNSSHNNFTFTKSPAAGKVLMCKDSNGEAEWKLPEQQGLPSDPEFDSVTTDKLTVTSILEALTTNDYFFNPATWASYVYQGTAPTENVNHTTEYVIGTQLTVPPNTTRGYKYRTNLWVDFFWRYRSARLTVNESLNFYFRVFKITARIFRDEVIVEERNIMAKKWYPTSGIGIRMVHDRYITSTLGDSVYGTYFQNKIFIYSPEIWFNVLKSSSEASYRVEFKIEYSYQFQGDFPSTTPPAEILISPSTLSWFKMYTLDNLDPGAQDPINYYTTAYDGSKNYGFQATIFPTGNDINTASVQQFVGVYWGVTSNGSSSSGSRNSYEFRGYDLMYRYNFVSTSAQAGAQNISTLSVSNANITDLTCNNIYLPGGGVVHSSGYATRRGYPLDPPSGASQDAMVQETYDLTNVNDLITFNYKGSYNSWGNYFNIWWHTNNTLQFFVDYTYVNQLSMSSSDRRIKENFTEAPSVLNRLCQLPMYQFDFVQYEVIHPSQKHVGFIADELQDLFPDIPHLISEEKNKVDANGKFILQHRNDNEIISILIKAIQELRAEVMDLKTQLGLS